MTVTLPVFDNNQRDVMQKLLALRVAQMMGRKLEEADWTDVYCAALGIQVSSWSNLEIDIIHGHLGVEQKAIRHKDSPIDNACGTSFMHPSLTRSIRVNSSEPDPNKEMQSVFAQYAQLVESRREAVERQNTTGQDVEMRNGWLLWQDSLRQFLYFEELMVAPDPANYFAEWRDSGTASGRRKPSRSLWIFENESRRKRYSVTTDAGAKIQPYVDIPPPSDPNLYIFTVIGEHMDFGKVRVWITHRTAAELERVLGSLEVDVLEAAVSRVALQIDSATTSMADDEVEEVVPLVLSESVYGDLVRSLPGVNDDHRFQLLLDHLRRE